jgi:ABC transporter substrate binding protein
LSFFTIATAKTDESIQKNSGLSQGPVHPFGGRLTVRGRGPGHEDIIGTARQLAEHNKNRLVVESPDNLGSLTVDPMRLRQILLNLLSNACKFTKQGEVRLRVKRVVDGRDWIEIAVMWRQVGVELRETQIAARRLDLRLHSVPISADTSIENAFEKINKEAVQALIVVTDPILYSQRSQILDLAAGNRLPAMYPYREFPQTGGLMSYAPSDRDLFRRAASYVDRILKGANPGDLPVEQPTKFELVINLKTAKALGLDVPATLLARADEVIE